MGKKKKSTFKKLQKANKRDTIFFDASRTKEPNQEFLKFLTSLDYKPEIKVRTQCSEEVSQIHRSLEVLSHFSCPHCRKWFSISEAPIERSTWACPWCFLRGEYNPVQEPVNES